MSCDVDFGASGSPVFRIVDGRPEIVSVISAKAKIRGRQVSLGIAVDGPLDTLKAAMAVSEGSRFVRVPVARTGGAGTGGLPTRVLPTGEVGAVAIGAGGADRGGAVAGGMRAGGAKFLRP